MALLLLALLVVIALFWVLRRPQAARPPAASPYARDDAFGRPDPAWGAGMPPPQEGMGSSIARGVATGLAVGAGAAIAQELAHRAFEHGHDGQGYARDPGAPAPHHDQGQSQLARDAGIGALDPSADPQGIAGFDEGGWDDGGGVDDQGGWDA